MAGACWALPIPLVTSQTYVPKNNHIIYELIIIIMNTCLRPRTWWGRWWGLPLAGWSPGPEEGVHYKENEDQKWSDCYYELSIIWASIIVVMILILVVLFGCISSSAVFMHDFNLETKHSLKMKTDQGPRSKYCDCHLVSQDQSFCIWVHY